MLELMVETFDCCFAFVNEVALAIYFNPLCATAKIELGFGSFHSA